MTKTKEPADPYGPPAIEVERVIDWNHKRERRLAYPVLGTEGVWAVYQDDPDDNGKRYWVALHVPSGYAVWVEFASREDAEDLACWTWCNSVDQAGSTASSRKEASAALGARVKSRFRQGGPFKTGRRRWRQKIGRYEVEQTEAEEHFSKRLTELERDRAEFMKMRQREKLILKNRADELAVREADLKERIEKFTVEEGERLATIREREKRQYDVEVALDNESRQLDQTAIELRHLRTTMYAALLAVDLDDGLHDGQLGRRFRKIRIKGDSLPAQSAPAGSS